MGYWDGGRCPSTRARPHVPASRPWFGSCLGPTFPNRRFLVAGTAHGLRPTAAKCFDRPPSGTIFDLLTRHGIDWANYHGPSPRASPPHASSAAAAAIIARSPD